MIADIKRATEVYICEKLSQTVIPPHTFVPFTGGSEFADAAQLEPPFTIVAIDDAQRTHAQDATWICKGTVQIITHANESTSRQHAELVRSIYVAVAAIDTDASDPLFSFHGLDIDKMRSAQDSEENMHADVIDIVVGVGG